MQKAISLLVACGLAAPALAGPPVNEMEDSAPVLNAEAAPAGVGGGADDPGDPCSAADLETITGDNRLLGIGYGWGFYWVTGSGLLATGSGPEFQRLYQFDTDWNLVETYEQASTSATWGGRDSAIIESENRLFVGAEAGELQIWTFDPSTERMDETQTETEFTSVFSVGTVRALAYHPGRDTFFTKDFSSAIIEFDRDGVEVGFWPDPGMSAYGAAYDPVNDTIWFNASCVGCPTGAAGPNSRLVEWDPDTGALTGREIDTADLIFAPPGWTGWVVGGLDIFMNGDQVVFVALYQGNPGDFGTVLLGDGTAGCPDAGCFADCDESGELDFFDFLCFQNQFAAGDLQADCDESGSLDFFDFLCFQNEFAAGCP